MTGVIDRFEEQLAVIEKEDGSMMNLPRERLPRGAKEGDVVLLGETITIDYEETKRRKKEIEELTKELWQ